MKRQLVGLTLALLVAGPVASEDADIRMKYPAFVEARELQDAFKAKDDPAARAFAAIYIAGVIDATNAYASSAEFKGVRPLCIPEGTSDKMPSKVVEGFLEANPHYAKYVASVAVTVALHRMWPCQ